jgi:hypothetical protein
MCVANGSPHGFRIASQCIGNYGREHHWTMTFAELEQLPGDEGYKLETAGRGAAQNAASGVARLERKTFRSALLPGIEIPSEAFLK